jgi:hypothetical protein
MMRHRLLCLMGLAALAACNDSTPTSATRPTGVDRVRSIVVTGSLDENISIIINFWPGGTANAIQSQWDGIKSRLAAGDVAGAQKKLEGLTNYILKKTDGMNAPPTHESKPAAASRLILYMSLYVFDGPNTSPPDFFPQADNAVGILTPGSELTLVTPTKHAGAHFDAGSVAEDRIIVITQNPTNFVEDCTGPLVTTLCQWPQFYTIESFPHGALLKVAQASVCHDNAGSLRNPPPGIHNNFRLAHPLPADPANYVPGGTILDDEGNQIEILPLITQSFVICDEVIYHPPEGGGGGGGGEVGLLDRGVYLANYLASRVGQMLLPRSAYAIDHGGGGEFLDFGGSPFNDVDPGGEIGAPTHGHSGKR